MKVLALAAASLVFGVAFAQTPPIKPQTPDPVVPPPVTIPVPPEVLSLQPMSESEAVAMALARNRAIVSARAAVEAARGRVRQAQAELNPQLGVSGGFTEQEQIRGTQQNSQGTNRFTTNLSLEQLLFDFGRARAAVRQQRALEGAARSDLTRTEHDLALQTRLAFHATLEAQQLLAAAEGNVANRQRQLAQAEARVESGLGAPADMVRAKTTLADAVLALELARATVLNARTELAELLGVDPRTPIALADAEAAAAAAELQSLVAQALERRPEIEAARQRVRAAGLGVAVARLSNAPRVSAVANLAGRGPNDPLTSQTGSLGVLVSWSFGDGGLAAGRTQEARANEEAARANLEALGLTVISEVTQAYVDLATARQRVETAQVLVANATELLRISEGRYSGGIGQFLEVTDAQNSLVSAQRSLAQAQADLNRASARLRRATGST